jgi:PAS domain S-box-containing protein
MLSGVLLLLALFLGQPEDGLLFLLVVPITMVAADHGIMPATLMATVATIILVVTDTTRPEYALTAIGYGSRIGLYYLTAVIVSRLTERLRSTNETLIGSIHSEQMRNSALLNSVGALVAILDPKGRVTYFNPASERASGYKAEEVLGKRLVDVVVPASHIDEVNEVMLNLRPEHLPASAESFWLTKEGRQIVIRWNATGITGPNGEIEHLICTGLDVTDRYDAEQKVAESQELLSTYFEHAPSLLFWLDLDGNFVEVNKAVEELTNQPRENIIGRPATDFFSPEIADSIRRTSHIVLAEGRTIQAEDAIDTPSGVQRFQTVKFPLRNSEGEIYGIGGTSYNITALIEAREAVERARHELVGRLARAVEYRDEATVDHVERMSTYCEMIARRLGFNEERCRDIRMASAMHDAGKIAVPDSILLKPGPLTATERRIMETHAEVGWNLLSGSEWDVLELAALIAYTHHERFDGGGYPRGLAGSEIPIEGRITAVADVFDALTTDRVYRAALTAEQALDVMRAGRGTHFDPLVFDAFLADWEAIKAVKKLSRKATNKGTKLDLPFEVF